MSFSPIYIINAKPYNYNSEIYIDYLYITENEVNNDCKQIVNLLRVKNPVLEFLVAKPPSTTIEAFHNKAKELLAELKLNITTKKMKDSQLFSFDFKYDYLSITATNPFVLKQAKDILETYLLKYYSKLKVSKINSYDKIFYDNTESPFRYVSNVLSLSKIPYYICTRYDFPCIGGIGFNFNKLKKSNLADLETEYLTQTDNINTYYYELEFEDFINRISTDIGIKQKAEKYSGSLKLMSYDIETFNLGKSNLTPLDNEQKIINIGFSMFNLSSTKPLKRFSIISRMIDEEELKDYKYTKQQYRLNNLNYTVFEVKDFGKEIDKGDESDEESVEEQNSEDEEQNTDDNNEGEEQTANIVEEQKSIKTLTEDGNTIIDFGATDSTSYVCFKSSSNEDADEAKLLKLFIHYISKYRPYIITGYNTWKFDDEWIYVKCEKHNLADDLLQALDFYELPPEIEKRSYYSTVKYEQVNPKIDNQKFTNSNYHTITHGFTTFHDVMAAALKEDAKRFSNSSKARSLNNMLKIYNITSPYNNLLLSKSGLKIKTMFRYWKERKNTYLIAKYCCQDAWITGTFAIKKNMIGDLIEMSNITYTNLYDSLLKAVGTRISNTITYYAYHENFALFDSPDQESRTYRLKSPLGNKFYDKRPYIGGEVKNKRNGRAFFIMAHDFSSMYPSQKEGSNFDTSSRIDPYILEHPDEFGLHVVDSYSIEDIYTYRKFIKLSDGNNIYEIEQIFAENKIDKKFLIELRDEYNKTQNVVLLDRFKEATLNYLTLNTYDEIKEHLLNDRFENYPLTVLKPIYFCQSPKYPDILPKNAPKDALPNRPKIHYSLKEKMLSTLRALRNAVKKELSTCKDPTRKIQLSAKEKAIKVIMNGEYGQTASDLFSHYDPDIGSTVTFASRRCIHELTTCLNSEHFYVDEEYLNNKYIQQLKEYPEIKDLIQFEEITNFEPTFEKYIEASQRSIKDIEFIKENSFDGNLKFVKDCELLSLNEFALPPRRLTLSRLYDKLKEYYLKNNTLAGYKFYCLCIPKSKLVYQDTDSNYYTNDTFVETMKVINPETINRLMNIMMVHNNLLGCLIPDIIHRSPISVGFEGSFIVARYLNRKKKYFGKKWNDHMTSYIDIPRSLNYVPRTETERIAFNTVKPVNGKIVVRYNWDELPSDYENYLNPYLSTIPYKDGSYLDISFNKIGDMDYIDYLAKNGIKCTGVDLARRDTFGFVNYHHLIIMKNDLRYTDTSDKEITNLKNFKLRDIIDDLMDNYYTDNVKNNKFIFPLEFYAKTKCNNGKKTEIADIINKLKDDVEKYKGTRFEDELKSVIPAENERAMYVVISPLNEIELSTGNGKANKDKGYLLDHLRKLGFTNEQIFKSLDYEFYFTQLAKAMAKYLAIETDESIGDYLTDEYIMTHLDKSEKEIEIEMKKKLEAAEKEIVKTYVNKYFKHQRIKMVKDKYDGFNIELEQEIAEVFELEKKLNVRVEHMNYDNMINSIKENCIRIVRDGIEKSLSHVEYVMNNILEKAKRSADGSYDVEYVKYCKRLISVCKSIIIKCNKRLGTYIAPKIHLKIWYKGENKKNLHCYNYVLSENENRKNIDVSKIVFNEDLDGDLYNKDNFKKVFKKLCDEITNTEIRFENNDDIKIFIANILK